MFIRKQKIKLKKELVRRKHCVLLSRNENQNRLYFYVRKIYYKKKKTYYKKKF